MAWDEWHESIERGRRELEFDPAWSDERVGEWVAKHYPTRVRPKAQAEINAMGLPPTFLEFWEDCLYNEYRGGEGKPRPAMIHRVRSGRRSEPNPPFKVALVWEPDEDVHGPWVRMEIMIHTEFCTHDLYQDAASLGWDTIRQHLYLNNITPHPVAVLATKVKPNVSERKENAIDRYVAGEVSFDDLITEEWESPEVRAQLAKVMATYPTQYKRDRELKAVQKKVYNKVKRWFGSSAPEAEVRGQWRKAMPLPIVD